MSPIKSDAKIIRVSVHDPAKFGGLIQRRNDRVYKKKNSIVPTNDQISGHINANTTPNLSFQGEQLDKTLISSHDFDILRKMNTIQYKDEKSDRQHRRRRCGAFYMTSCCCCYSMIAAILLVLLATIIAAIVLLLLQPKITTTTTTSTTSTSTSSTSETTLTTVTTVTLTCNTCNSLCWNQTAAILAGTSSSTLSDPRCINFDVNDTMYLSAHSLGYVLKSPLDYTNRTQTTPKYGDHIDYIIFDNNGYMYTNDHNDKLVRRFSPNSPNGTIVAGTGSSVTGTLKKPFGLAIDDNFTLYICDSDTKKIYKLEQNASALVQVIDTSSYTKTPSALLLSINSSDEIYVSDEGGTAVYLWKFNSATPTTIYTDVENGVKLSGPRGMKLDADGNLYVADKNNLRIVMFCTSANSTNGTIIAQVPSTPADLAFDSHMNLYTIGSGSGKVYKFELY